MVDSSPSMTVFEQFMLLVLVCTGIMYAVLSYQWKQEEMRRKKDEAEARTMRLLMQEPRDPTLPPRRTGRYRMY